jgi:hypothetical protein
MAGLAAIYQRAFAVVPQFRAALHCGPVIVSECGSAKRQPFGLTASSDAFD